MNVDATQSSSFSYGVNPTVHFVSLGCARNLVDTEVMLGLVNKRGFKVVARPERADVIVVNTCGFLQEAKEEGYAVLEALFAQKKKKARVIVAGCMVRQEKEALKKRFPQIHYFLGSGDVDKILLAVAAKEKGETISLNKSYLQGPTSSRTLSTPAHFAYLKISEGCSKRCSFCVIPLLKGPLKSKTEEQVLKEFSSLLDRGVFEVILIAQDLGDFGKDRKEEGGLERLLKRMLLDKRPFWLRLLYLYPDEITEGLIEVLKSDARICPYLDIPLQHIHDQVLHAMRRKTTKEQILKVLSWLRLALPHAVIRTSLMVGFPGESEEHFEELLSFIKEQRLDNIGLFKYSPEKQTIAVKMALQVPEEVKEERYNRAMELQREVSKEKMRSYVGKRLQVLVDGYHRDSSLLLTGRFYGQSPDVDGQVILNDWQEVSALGKRYWVEITEAHDYDLVGRVVSYVT